jgi:hypothetical protein
LILSPLILVGAQDVEGGAGLCKANGVYKIAKASEGVVLSVVQIDAVRWEQGGPWI